MGLVGDGQVGPGDDGEWERATVKVIVLLNERDHNHNPVCPHELNLSIAP